MRTREPRWSVKAVRVPPSRPVTVPLHRCEPYPAVRWRDRAREVDSRRTAAHRMLVRSRWMLISRARAEPEAVVVVEDNPGLAALLADELTDAGYAVTVTGSAG